MAAPPVPAFPRSLWALGPVVVALFSIVPVWWPETPPEGTRIVQSRGVVLSTAAIAVIWFFTLLAVSTRANGRRGPAIWSLLLALFPLAYIALIWTGALLSGWRIAAEDQSSSGREFAWLYAGFGDGPVEVARKTDHWWLAACHRTLASGYSYRGVRAIRPAGLAASTFVARNGCVAWIDGYIVRCAATEEGAPLVETPRDEDRRVSVVQNGSAFFLVGPDESVEPADIDRVEKAVAGIVDEFIEHDEWLELPTDEGLREGLASDNASIREAAARLVRAGGSTLYPQASRLLPR